jgi:hypothetical protein
MFLHLPVNHRYHGVYRFLGGLTGLYVLGFGIAGLSASQGYGLFARDHIVALGLRTNTAFSILSIVVGAVVVIAAVINNNREHYVNLFGGIAFLTVGILMMTLMETELNLLNFTMATCVVSFIVGLVLLTAGLYTRSGPVEETHEVERFRHRSPRRNGHTRMAAS